MPSPGDVIVGWLRPVLIAKLGVSLGHSVPTHCSGDVARTPVDGVISSSIETVSIDLLHMRYRIPVPRLLHCHIHGRLIPTSPVA